MLSTFGPIHVFIRLVFIVKTRDPHNIDLEGSATIRVQVAHNGKVITWEVKSKSCSAVGIMGIEVGANRSWGS